MFRTIAFASLLATSTAAAGPNTPNDQLLSLVRMELPDYLPEVDAADLSRHQLAAIYSIMHSRGSRSERAAMIRSVVGGGFSLRGMLFN